MTEANRNLFVRIASALILLPGVIVLAWLGGLPFALLIVAVAGISAWEFAGITLARVSHLNRWSLVVIAELLPLLFLAAQDTASLGTSLFPLLVVVFFIINLLVPGDDLTPVPARVGLSVMGVLYTGGLLTFTVLLRESGPDGFWWLLLLMAVTWFNDTGGYAAGRLFGRHKLYPRISPGKTWEGFVGGALASVGGAFLVAWVSRLIPFVGMQALSLEVWELAAIGVITGFTGPLGDLSESLLKRAYGAKDSSRILPGHGGLLDRIDALLFNAAVLYLWASMAHG